MIIGIKFAVKDREELCHLKHSEEEFYRLILIVKGDILDDGFYWITLKLAVQRVGEIDTRVIWLAQLTTCRWWPFLRKSQRFVLLNGIGHADYSVNDVNVIQKIEVPKGYKLRGEHRLRT